MGFIKLSPLYFLIIMDFISIVLLFYVLPMFVYLLSSYIFTKIELQRRFTIEEWVEESDFGLWIAFIPFLNWVFEVAMILAIIGGLIWVIIKEIKI